MRHVLASSIFGYLFFQSWTSAFSPNPLLPPHLFFGIISICLFGLYFISKEGGVSKSAYRLEDILPVLLVIVLTSAALWTPRGMASLRYVAAYSYVFLGAYLLIKGAVANAGSARFMLDAVLAGVMVTAAVSTLEFILDFFGGVDIGAYLLRAREIDALYRGVPRSAAFSTEPGILAFYMETLGLIGAWWSWRRFQSQVLIFLTLVLIFIGWAVAFSAGSIASLSIGGTVALIIRSYRSRNASFATIFYLLTPILVVTAVLVIRNAQGTFFGPIISRITLGDVPSAVKRVQRWIEGFQTIAQYPILGEGPGTAASQRGEVAHTSWYIFLAAEAGLLSLAIVFCFLFFKLKRIIKSSIYGSYIFVASFVAGVVHLSVISTFFHPFLWTLLIIFDVLDSR